MQCVGWTVSQSIRNTQYLYLVRQCGFQVLWNYLHINGSTTQSCTICYPLYLEIKIIFHLSSSSSVNKGYKFFLICMVVGRNVLSGGYLFVKMPE